MGANGIHSVEGTNSTCKKIGGCRGGFGKVVFAKTCGFDPGTPVSSQEKRDFLASTPLSFIREKFDGGYIS